MTQSSEHVAKPPGTPSVFTAPGGLKFFHHAAAETKYVYNEIFEEAVYFRHGIRLLERDAVFDIGANIGLFTMYVMETFAGVTVHAFEPSPPIFPLLQANIARYGNAVRAHPCGIAGRSGQATLTYYPGYSIMSGFHTEAVRDRETLRAGIRAHLVQQNMDSGLIQDRFLNPMIEAALGSKQEFICRLRTISEMIDETGLMEIGLVKIDAEGAELQILSGIRDEHWSRLRQFVLEIHDSAGTRGSERLFAARGFCCVMEQEKRLSGSGVQNCYVLRR
jgi:FkbM family methyltransferase